jgi:hypothetical protein
VADLLDTVGRAPSVRFEEKGCHEFVAALIPKRPRYRNLIVWAADGSVSCSALPFAPAAPVRRSPDFQQILDSREIPKPFTAEQLFAKLAEVLDAGGVLVRQA